MTEHDGKSQGDPLAAWIEAVESGEGAPSLASLLAGREDLLPGLERLVRAYESLDRTMEARLQADAGGPRGPGACDGAEELPRFEGFRTVKRIGSGGAGTVYELVDLALGRTVAAKVLRRANDLGSTQRDFLREAASLARFADPRIVAIHEFRQDADPPVIIMEHVEGFRLADVAPSLEVPQRARIVAEICAAVHVAHRAGITHRDLKPSNVMLTAGLEPKILDFGLASADPSVGHGRGTPHYLAPEQLDATRPMDGRTDVHALGVILYELLCGAKPYEGDTVAQVLEAIERGDPRLPVEARPGIPEPLQAVALKAMAHEPADRYATAAEMEDDLRRYLAGRPVLARPALYGSALARRVRSHVEDLRVWRQLRLVHPHEAASLQAAYARLEAREDDWIVASRTLSIAQVLLYLGALLVTGASALAYWAFRVEHGISADWSLALVGLPAAGLSLAALRLHARRHEAAGVAFTLAGALPLPIVVLVLLERFDLLAFETDVVQLLPELATNRQLQAALVVGGLWAWHGALRTRTAALGTAAALLAALAALAAAGDLGLAAAIEDQRWDRAGLRLLPIAALLYLGALATERRGRPTLAFPLHVAAAVAFVTGLELFALDGRELHRLGVRLAALAPDSERLATLLETHVGLALNGCVAYGIAALLERTRSDLQRRLASWMFAACPILTLEPVFRICAEDEFGAAVDSAFVAGSLAFVFLSHFHERKSFYYSGLANLCIALFLVTDHRDWFGSRDWALSLVLAGAGALAAGVGVEVLERRRGAS